MPQTLLALLALTTASLYTLGQQRASIHTVDAVVRDEFELIVAGTLLHAMEFADSRSFDQATTPARLVERLGLSDSLTVEELEELTLDDLADIGVDDFASAGSFGKDPYGSATRCVAVQPLTSSRCDDVSDLHSARWQNLTLTAPNGDPLPVEVRFDVQYVERDAPDVAVGHKTFHKRVEVWARTPHLTRDNPDYKVILRRVVSYDPVTALEHLLRTAGRVIERPPLDPALCDGGVAALQAAVASAQAAADAARQQAATAASVSLTAQNEADVKGAVAHAAQAALASAQGQATSAQAAAASAATALATAQAGLTAAQANLTAADQAVTSAQATVATSTANVTSAQAAVNSAVATYNNTTGLARYYHYYVVYLPAVDDLEAAVAGKASAQAALTAAQNARAGRHAAVANAQSALTAAQTNHTNALAPRNAALAAVTSAETARTAAWSQWTAAQAAAATAASAAATAAQTAAAADQALANAQAALAGAECA